MTTATDEIDEVETNETESDYSRKVRLEREEKREAALAEAAAILKFLPEEWKIDADADCHAIAVVPCEPDGRRLRFGYDNWRNSGRWVVSGEWPKTKDNHNWGPRNDESVDSITIDRNRPARAIAADIQRRYIEPYTAIWPVCAARAKAHDDREDRRLAILLRLVSVCDPEFKAKERKRIAKGYGPSINRGSSSHNCYAGGIRKIDVSSDGLVQIETDHRLTPELAEKILRMMAAEWRRPAEDESESEDE